MFMNHDIHNEDGDDDSDIDHVCNFICSSIVQLAGHCLAAG